MSSSSRTGVAPRRAARGARPKGAREQALAVWRSLMEDDFSQALFRDNGVGLHLFWLDETSSQISALHADEQRLVRMTHGELESTSARFGERTSGR